MKNSAWLKTPKRVAGYFHPIYTTEGVYLTIIVLYNTNCHFHVNQIEIKRPQLV